MNAIVKYLIGCNSGYTIGYVTSIDGYRTESGEYDIALMTEQFLMEEEKHPSQNKILHHKIQLCSGSDVGSSSYETIYKFQSMDAFTSRLSKVDCVSPRSVRGRNATKFLGIYSPIRHELSLPFSLLYCDILKESGKVLFIDLEENSALNHLMRRESRKSLLDSIYELELNPDNFDLEPYLECRDGIYYIGPVNHPTDLAGIRAHQWMRFHEMLRSEGFDYIVELFGEIPEGFENFLEEMTEMTILGKSGRYYEAVQSRFVEFIRDECEELKVEEVMLPMSIGSLSENEYQLEEMAQGNLGIYVRKMMARRAHYGA